MDIEVIINELAGDFFAKVKGFDTNFGLCEQGIQDKSIVIVQRNGIDFKKVGLTDNKGNYFYIRLTHPIKFQYPKDTIIQSVISCRLVACAKKAELYAFEYVCRMGLLQLNKGIKLLESQTSIIEILLSEINLKEYPPNHLTFIAIDFQINNNETNCPSSDCELKIPCKSSPQPIPPTPPCVCGVTFAEPPFIINDLGSSLEMLMSVTNECQVLEYQLQRLRPDDAAFFNVGSPVPYNAGAGGNYALTDPSVPPNGTLYQIKVIFTVSSGCPPIFSNTVIYP
jgi:hypothetical protein